MDDANPSTGSWWQDALKTVINGAVRWKQIEVGQHGTYELDAWGRPIYQGQPAPGQAPGAAGSNQKVFLIGGALLGVVLLVVLLKKV